jgi:phosphoglycolate phosphatase
MLLVSKFFVRIDMFGLSLTLSAVIFDLDGTLINSAVPFKDMKRKIIAYLQANGVTIGLLNEDMLNSEIMNLAVSDFQQKGFSRNQISEILAQASRIMNEVELQSAENATLIEGVPQTLYTLKKQGLKLGIMTRGCREYTCKILAKFDLGKFFDAVVARDDVDQPKPNPEHAFRLLKLLGVRAQETLFVGDHWSDAECAGQAGLRFIFVGRGQGLERVRELGYQAVDSINDIIKFIESNKQEISPK